MSFSVLPRTQPCALSGCRTGALPSIVQGSYHSTMQQTFFSDDIELMMGYCRQAKNPQILYFHKKIYKSKTDFLNLRFMNTDGKAAIVCFSQLHPPYVVSLEGTMSGTITRCLSCSGAWACGYLILFPEQKCQLRKNTVLLKDKSSYAHCVQTDTVAFCGGVESDYIISLEVVFLRLSDSTCKVSFMNLQRIGAAAVFVHDQLFVFGGRVWGESRKGSVIPFRRPLVLADNFETCVDDAGGKKKWRLSHGMGGMPRCYSAAVSIDKCAYLIGGYCNSAEITQSPSPKASKSVQVYNTALDSWSNFPSMNFSRAECGAATLHSFRIYVVGGLDNGNPVHVNEYFDMANSMWTMMKEHTPLPLGPSSVCVVGSSLYVVGQVNHSLVRLDTMEEKWEEVFQLPHLYEFIVPITKTELMRRHSAG